MDIRSENFKYFDHLNKTQLASYDTGFSEYEPKEWKKELCEHEINEVIPSLEEMWWDAKLGKEFAGSIYEIESSKWAMVGVKIDENKMEEKWQEWLKTREYQK